MGDVVYEQAAALNYMPQRSAIPSTIELVRKIAEITPGTLNRTFPVSSGSEANETAIKVARAYHKRNGESGRYKIVSRFGSYHGDLGLVQWFGSTPDHRTADYEPAYPGMVYAPQPNVYRCGTGDLSPSECAVRCARAVEDLIKFHQPNTVAAVIAEPVTNDGVVPGPEYWPMLREICNEYGVVLIADEVTTGLGRTGKMYGVDHWGVEPDIMTMAGGLSGGYMPIGAVTATTAIADRFAGTDSFFRHVFTFAGHPVVGGRSAEEHRDHRVGGAGRERRRVRRVPHGVAIDPYGRSPYRGGRSRAGAAVRHRACERPHDEGRVRPGSGAGRTSDGKVR